MKKILETLQVEFGKSNYLIDLVSEKGNKHVEIIQVLLEHEGTQWKVKLHPFVISKLISVLKHYQKTHFSNRTSIQSNQSEEQKIVSAYLKGVSIKDLSRQKGMSERNVESILRLYDIAIVSNKPPKSYFNKYWMKKKK